MLLLPALFIVFTQLFVCLARTASVAVDLKQPKCEMSFQTEIEFLVTVPKAGYLYSFFFTSARTWVKFP